MKRLHPDWPRTSYLKWGRPGKTRCAVGRPTPWPSASRWPRSCVLCPCCTDSTCHTRPGRIQSLPNISLCPYQTFSRSRRQPALPLYAARWFASCDRAIFSSCCGCRVPWTSSGDCFQSLNFGWLLPSVSRHLEKLLP
jgi:hypothetical protein